MKYTKKTVPENKQDEGAEYCGSDIDKNRGKIAGTDGNIPKDNLLHGIVRIDIKHVDRTVFIQRQINSYCDQAAGQVKGCCACKCMQRKEQPGTPGKRTG